MREDVIRAHAELAVGLRAHPPAAPGRLDAHPQGDAAHLLARALPRPRRADPRARPGRRAHHGHHRRLPGGDRGRLPRDARGGRGGRLRRRVHVHLLAPPRHRGGRAGGRRRRTRRRSSGCSASSRSSSGARASAPSASSGARWRCSSRAPRARTRTACAAARATTRSSTSAASPQPGELVDVEIHEATSQTLRGEQGAAARCARRRLSAHAVAFASVRLCEHTFVRWDGQTDRGRTSGRRLPGPRRDGRDPPLRRAGGARHALLRGPGQERAQPRARAPRGCRSSGRSTRTGAARMPASTASRGRRTSTSTSTRGATSSARSSSRSTSPRCCGPSSRGRRGRAQHVAMGTNTDPYQWVEGRYKLMRGIWEALRDAANPCSILTKSPLLLRDVDLLREVADAHEVSACLSVPTLDEKAWRASEPHTPHPRARLEAVAELNRGRHPDGHPHRAAHAGHQRRAGAGRADHRARHRGGRGHRSAAARCTCAASVRGIFFDWLRGYRPDLVPRYEQLYARGAYVPDRERRAIERAAGLPRAPTRRAQERFRHRGRARRRSAAPARREEVRQERSSDRGQAWRRDPARADRRGAGRAGGAQRSAEHGLGHDRHRGGEDEHERDRRR